MSLEAVNKLHHCLQIQEQKKKSQRVLEEMHLTTLAGIKKKKKKSHWEVESRELVAQIEWKIIGRQRSSSAS